MKCTGVPYYGFLLPIVSKTMEPVNISNIEWSIFTMLPLGFVAIKLMLKW